MGGRVLVRAAGGWELTELGRQALTAAEGVESAVRSLTRRRPPARRPPEGRGPGIGDRRVQRLHRAPAGALMQRRHPRCPSRSSRTRRASQHRSGLDIEIVVGKPQVHRAEALRLAEHPRPVRRERYLSEHGTPRKHGDLADHSLVYFIDSMLQVDELDLARPLTPDARIGDVDQRVRARRGHPGVGGHRIAAVLHGRPPRRPRAGAARDGRRWRTGSWRAPRHCDAPRWPRWSARSAPAWPINTTCCSVPAKKHDRPCRGRTRPFKPSA